jgi:hypothetical protein
MSGLRGRDEFVPTPHVQRQLGRAEPHAVRLAVIVRYEVCERFGELARRASSSSKSMASSKEQSAPRLRSPTALGWSSNRSSAPPASPSSMRTSGTNGLWITHDAIDHAGSDLAAAREAIAFAKAGSAGRPALRRALGDWAWAERQTRKKRLVVISSLFHKRLQSCLFTQPAAQPAREMAVADGGPDAFPVSVRRGSIGC